MTTQGEAESLTVTKKLISSNSENFPVGSFFIPRECRPHVYAFYRFARQADDIADNPRITAEKKISQLVAIQHGLEGDGSSLPAWARDYHRSLSESGSTPKNGQDLLSAFIQDATKVRYSNWEELIDYCMLSAASVGRVILDIHDESTADIKGCDALCCALQILNHIQDCGKDYRELGRVYLPEAWVLEAGGQIEHLSYNKLTPELRLVLNQCLSRTEELLLRAKKVAPTIKRRGLRMEFMFILYLAQSLHRKLMYQDPLASNVKVDKSMWLVYAFRSIFRTWIR